MGNRKNKVQKVDKFSTPKNMVSKHHVKHANRHNLPAIYHAISPQIPATPIKNPSKRHRLASTHHAKKKLPFRNDFSA
jgi:hypothetical protein